MEDRERSCGTALSGCVSPVAPEIFTCKDGAAWLAASPFALNREIQEMFYAVAAAARRCWKHSRQKTGRPWVGLKGTVVSLPQPEHVVRVSTFW